jgi:hypothetical protein
MAAANSAFSAGTRPRCLSGPYARRSTSEAENKCYPTWLDLTRPDPTGRPVITFGATSGGHHLTRSMTALLLLFGTKLWIGVVLSTVREHAFKRSFELGADVKRITLLNRVMSPMAPMSVAVQMGLLTGRLSMMRAYEWVAVASATWTTSVLTRALQQS